MAFFHQSLRCRVFIALMAAISMLVMLTFGVPLIPAAPYLKYEPSGAVILICGLLFGKYAALQCACLKSVLYFFIHGGNPYGILSDLIATIAFTWLASGLYGKTHEVSRVRMAGCCLAGCISATLVMIPANFAILPLQFGMSGTDVLAIMTYIIFFNLLKSICNSVLAGSIFPYIMHVTQKLYHAEMKTSH